MKRIPVLSPAWLGRYRTLLTAASVYALRVLSGLGTLIAILVIGRFYGADEIAHFAVFMFLFNLGTLIAIWGGNVVIVDKVNRDGASSVGAAFSVAEKLIDSIIVAGLMYLLLSHWGFWNVGLLAVIPVSLAGILAAFLVVSARPVSAMLSFEFCRAALPLLCLLLILYVWPGIEFDSLIAGAYLALFVLLPVLMCQAGRHTGFRWPAVSDIRQWLCAKRRDFPVLLPQLMIVLVVQGDRFVIEYLGTAMELASYFAAQVLYTVIVFAGHAVYSVVTPRVSRVAQESCGSMRAESRTIFNVVGVLSLCLIPVAYFYFRLIGVDVQLATHLFLMFCASGIVALLLGVGLQSMQFHADKRAYVKIVFYGLVIQYLSVFLLYDTLGVYAVGLGFVFYNVLTSVMAWSFWTRKGVSVAPFSLRQRRS